MIGDVDKETLIRDIDHVLETTPGALCYVKWTCPRCGDRVTADNPNTFNTGGYIHTERADGSPCGSLYTGNRFGFRLIVINPATREKFTMGSFDEQR